MSPLEHAPLSFAAVGATVGLLYWNTGQASISVVTGYFLGKLLQSIVWTVTDPRTSG